MVYMDDETFTIRLDDEKDKRIAPFLKIVYYEARLRDDVLDKGDELIWEGVIKQLLQIVEKIGWEKADNILFLVSTLLRDHGIKAVETALQRELHLRERTARYGGRPSVVKEFRQKIDSICEGYHDNPLLSPIENLKKRIEQIKLLLDDVKRGHSIATYYRVREYALEKIKELESKLSDLETKMLLQKAKEDVNKLQKDVEDLLDSTQKTFEG